MSIRSKLFLILAAAAVPLLIFSLVSSFVTQSAFAKQSEVELGTDASIESQRIAATLEELEIVVTEMAGGSDLAASVDKTLLAKTENRENRLADLREQLSQLRGDALDLTVVGADTAVIATSAESGIAVPEDLVTKARLRPTIGAAFQRSAVDHRFFVAAPINSTSEPTVLVAEFPLEPIASILELYQRNGETRDAFLVQLTTDGGVQVITSQRFDPGAAFAVSYSTDEALGELYSSSLLSSAVVREIVDSRGEGTIQAVSPVLGSDWAVVVKSDSSEAFAGLESVRTPLLIMTLAAGGLALLLVGIWTTRLLARVRNFTDAARSIRAGHLSTRINDGLRDELGAFSRVFDSMTESLQASLEAKDEFVASVSHELRTPLTAVLGLSSEIASNHDSLSSDEIADFCGIISSQTTEVANIVEDLLTVARADRGVLALRRTNLPMEEEVRASLESLPPDLVRRTDVGIVPCVAYADSTRVRQILRNLLTNAHRYGGNSIQLRVSPGRNGMVSIRVRDNGPGVSQEHVEAIFAPYMRAHSREGLTESVGLGLTVSRRLSRVMDGDLKYRRVDGWTVFELTLPTPAPVAADETEPTLEEV